MNRISAAAALLACFSLCSAPAAALEMPRSQPGQVRSGYDPATETVENRRSDHRRDRYRGRDNGIDAGDVIAGVLILGGIAAIAGAASQSRERVERPYPQPEGGRSPTTTYQSNGMGRAVDMCVADIEQAGDRVASVDSAARGSEGWFVSGEVEGGAPFTCRIGNDGRIADVETGDGWIGDQGDADESRYAPPSGAIADRQYDDGTYSRARAAISTRADYVYAD